MSGELQKKRSEELKQSIVDTALDIALKEGLNALSVRKLSANMGYSTGVIYHHFQDKDEIIQEILIQQESVLQQKIMSALQGAKSFEDSFRAVYYNVFLLAREKPPLYALIAQSFLSGTHKTSAQLSMLEHNLQKAYGHLNMNIPATAHAIWSSFIGFNLSISSQQNLSMKEAEALFEEQLRLILHGLPEVLV